MSRSVVVIVALLIGCNRPPAPPPAGADLPPAYLPSRITDPAVAEAGRSFTAWAEAQQAEGQRLFSKVEVLRPVPTLQPYGIGTYNKELRLPALVTIGPGWSRLPAEAREALVGSAFDELTARLGALSPPLRPTLTVQTPQGLELAWINESTPGRKLLHGDGE